MAAATAAAAAHAAPSAEWRGRLVLVTGSTMGIGKGIAAHFVGLGARVIVNGRSAEAVQKVVDSLRPLCPPGGEVLGAVGDVATTEGCAALTASVDKLGELAVLINNVGIFHVENFENVSDETWMKYFNVNVMSAVRLSRHYLPRMLKANKNGRILLIASEAGWRPIPTMIHYSTTKTAMIGLARGLAELTKGTTVTVNSVLAGPTWTEGVEEYLRGLHRSGLGADGKMDGKGASEPKAAEASGEPDVNTLAAEYFRTFEPTSLVQRFIRVEEIAAVVGLLASPAGAAINGHAQRVEGGIIRSI